MIPREEMVTRLPSTLRRPPESTRRPYQDARNWLTLALFISWLTLGVSWADTALAQITIPQDQGVPSHHLAPIPTDLPETLQAVREQLLTTRGDVAICLISPPISPEKCVSLSSVTTTASVIEHQDESLVPNTDRTFFLTLTQASTNIYHARFGPLAAYAPPEEITIASHEREISLELALAIQHVWAGMLRLSRPPLVPPAPLEGTHYEYETSLGASGRSRGAISGTLEGSAAELAAISEELATFAAHPEIEEATLLRRLHLFERTIVEPFPAKPPHP